MALYHFSLDHVKRSEGHTAIAAAAYRSGEKLYDRYYGEVQDYTRKQGVVMSQIFLPDHAPKRLADRETLWYEVEKNEKRKDAQLAYSFDFALQNELTMEENIEIAERFVKENFISRGMICDLAIHDPPREEGEERNIHAHGLCTMRPINENDEWGSKRLHIPVFDENGNPVLDENGKQRYDDPFSTDWGDPKTLEMWRENWEKIVNEKFAEKGLTCRIDHRSNEERGLDEIPQVHEGSAVRRMEKRGILTHKGSWNRWVKRTNDNIRRLLNALKDLTEWIKEARERVHRIENPTISNMVMTYYEHRDEVAEGYKHGTQKAKKGNLQYVAKVQVYIEQNNLTTIDDVERIITEKNDILKQAKDGLDGKKAELKRIKKNLSLIDDYYKYKSVYDDGMKIFFKAKQTEYREKHHAEMTRFHNILDNYGYMCNQYKTFGKSKCTSHWIEARDLYDAVLADIQRHAAMALADDEEFIEKLLGQVEQSKVGKYRAVGKELRTSKARLSEIDKLFAALYEEHISGKISDRNYEMMSRKYEKEQTELEQKIADMSEVVRAEDEATDNAEQFTRLIREYAGIEELDAALLNALIDKITVGEAKEVDGEKVQEVKIYYKFIGFIAGQEL